MQNIFFQHLQTQQKEIQKEPDQFIATTGFTYIWNESDGILSK